MENNVMAVLSLLMIGFGFIQGSLTTKLVKDIEVKELETKLEEADQQISKLKKELEEEKKEKSELLNNLNCLLNKHLRLPPPERPLKRSRLSSDCYSDSDEEFTLPTSPKLN